VIVGIDKNLYPKSYTRFFKPPLAGEIKSTVELIGHLDELEEDESIFHVREPDSKMTPLYHSGRRSISVGEARKIWNTEFKGLTRWEVKDHPRMKTQPGIFKLDPNKPPVTVRKQERQFDHRGFILTPRQLAIIQGVPDSFKLYIDSSQTQYWLNKARATVTKTPPYEVGAWFKRRLRKLIQYERDRT
jgi:site-specific DNA-cytosine methylase